MAEPVVINQKEYLKKYLSGDKIGKKKKKRNKLSKENRITVIDDDVSAFGELKEDEIDDDLFGTAEEQPQIVAVIDERPIHLQLTKVFSNKRPWRKVGESEQNLEDEKDLKTDDKELNCLEQTASNVDSKISDEKKSFIENVSSDTVVNVDETAKTTSKTLKGASNDLTYPRLKTKHESDGSPSRQKLQCDLNQSPPRQRKRHDSDQSPPRQSKRHDSHHSPSRQSKRHDSHHSPSRQRKRHDSDQSPHRGKRKLGSDQSTKHGKGHESGRIPQRRHTSNQSSPRQREQDDPDQSPPRQRKRHDSDQSPPRQRKRHDSDQSPPRQRKRHDSDESPPRQRRRHDSDQSPPRQRKQHDSDKSPPRQRKRHDSDQSPPRQRKRHDSDQSPPRQRKRHDSDQSISRNRKGHKSEHSPFREIKKANGYPRERNGDNMVKCMPNTLSGKKSGLQDSKSLKQESIEIKMKEDAAFLQVDEDLLGVNAETIVRDRKSGKKIDIPAELLKKREKAQVKQEYLDKYKVWSAGLKQIKDRQQKLDEEANSANKPLARYVDDEDLENELKSRDRDGDPMLKYFARKKAKQEKKENKPRYPMYQGPPPPMNRFDILPGYRWDGVDRSNGFEKKLFESIGLRKAQEEEAYKWSSADM